MTEHIKNKEMQTVVSNYTPHQDDNTLIDPQHFTNENFYDDRLTPNEKINVDEDKEELVIDESREEIDLNVDGSDTKDEEINVNETKKEDIFEPSWHPHVYGKPPKKPTPHSIDYILGNIDKNEKKSTVSQLMNVKINFDVKKSFAYQEKSIQVESDRNLINLHKNKLQEQLLQKGVRTSDSDDKVYHKCEEPLNLSVPKSKDSPGWIDEERMMKGRSSIEQILYFL